MSRAVAAGCALVLVVLVVVELAAVPIAQGALARAVRRCVEVRHVELLDVARPVTPRLVLGRARDVEVVATGVLAEGLRLERVTATLPEVVLPWAPFADGSPADATVTVLALERDLEAALDEVAPGWWQPRLDLVEDEVRLGDRRLGATLPIEVEVTVTGLRITPALGAPAWWDRLGVAEEVTLPDEVRLTELELRDDELSASAEVAVVPGVSGRGCELPDGATDAAASPVAVPGGHP